MTIDLVSSDPDAIDDNNAADAIVIVCGAIALAATAGSFAVAAYKWFTFTYNHLSAARYKSSEFHQRQQRCWPALTALMMRLSFHFPLLIMLNSLLGMLFQILRLTTHLRAGDDTVMNVLLFFYNVCFIYAHTISCRMATRVNVRIRYGSLMYAPAVAHLNNVWWKLCLLNVFTALVWALPFIVEGSGGELVSRVTVAVLMLAGTSPYWIDVFMLASELKQFEGLVAVAPLHADSEVTPSHKGAANNNLTPTNGQLLNNQQIKERELQGERAHSGWINSTRSAVSHFIVTIALALTWTIAQWPYAVIYWIFISQTYFAAMSITRMLIMVVNSNSQLQGEQTPTAQGRQIIKTTSASPITIAGRSIPDQDFLVQMPTRGTSQT